MQKKKETYILAPVQRTPPPMEKKGGEKKGGKKKGEKKKGKKKEVPSIELANFDSPA